MTPQHEERTAAGSEPNQHLTISTQFSRENREETRGCCREKRKGKQTGCERKTWYSLRGSGKEEPLPKSTTLTSTTTQSAASSAGQ